MKPFLKAIANCTSHDIFYSDDSFLESEISYKELLSLANIMKDFKKIYNLTEKEYLSFLIIYLVQYSLMSEYKSVRNKQETKNTDSVLVSELTKANKEIID